MRYQTLLVEDTSRKMVDTFRGYNHNLRIGDGEFFDMENMTADYYPVLSPRKPRGVYAQPAKALGLIDKDGLCYVDGASFVINGYPVDMGLNDEPKQLISMGAYVIIMPDKKYINTMDLTDYGNIEASYETTGEVSFQLCSIDGTEYSNAIVADAEPESPENLALWIDTSATPHTLKQYSAAGAIWVSVASTYIKISSAGIGKAFSQYDGVNISGVADPALQDLNACMVIWACADDYIVVTGILDAPMIQSIEEGIIQVERKMPNLDFITEAGNRLWGCRYGVAVNGEVVNEIYACKLGDFKNWNCFMGISTDSWVGSVGTDGQFTGAITHLGYPLFFKDNVLHKVYISEIGAHGLQDTACRGVQKGCEKSLAIVGETLFYKARSGVCAYDGSLPAEISGALGDMYYGAAVAGSHGNKYYISMQEAISPAYHLFVYDMAKGMWHREDGLQADAFCSCDDELYCIDHESGKILTMRGSGTQAEDMVRWMAETGEIGISSPDMKYVSRLTIRMAMEIGAEVSIYAQYDHEDGWEPLGTIQGTSLRSFSLPVRPRRCDHLKLRLEGVGDVKVYSITKTIEEGSDLS